MKLIYKTRATKRARFGLFLAHWCGLLDSLIGIFTFGIINARFRTAYLSSDLSERVEQLPVPKPLRFGSK